MSLSDVRTFQLKTAKDPRGELAVLEVAAAVPFAVTRLFYIRGVPPGTKRGEHAHKLCQQFLICQSGAIRVEMFDGRDWQTEELSEGDALMIPRGIYASETFLQDHTVLLVLCDRSYEPEDYINGLDGYAKYLAAKGQLPR